MMCFFHLYKVVILMFLDAATVIEPRSTSADGCAKDSGTATFMLMNNCLLMVRSLHETPGLRLALPRPMKSLCAMLPWCRVTPGLSITMLSMVY
jgi:hypothetical protein